MPPRKRNPETSERKEVAATPTGAEAQVDDKANGEQSTSASVGVSRLLNAMPLLKADTREKLLYKVACYGTPLGSDFFDQFTDMQEILTLALSISVRLLIVAICNSELAPTQRISAMRLIATLNGKQVPEDEDGKFKPGAPLAIPTGSKEDVSRTLEAIRRVSSESA